MTARAMCRRRSEREKSAGTPEQRIVEEVWQLTQAGDSWGAFDLVRTYVLSGSDGYAFAKALRKRAGCKKQLDGVP